MNHPKIFYLIFTKNEEATIQETLQTLRVVVDAFKSNHAQIAVVDDSTDATPDRVEDIGIPVIAGERRGLGHAYQKGVRWALAQGAEYVFTLDGDGQTDFQEIPRFWSEMERSRADLVLGSRFLNRDLIRYQYSSVNRWGVRLLATYLTLASGVKITDSHGGLRLMSRRAAETLELRGEHTYVQESILCVVRGGFKVIEIPSAWNPRQHGQSKVVRSKWTYIRNMTLPLIRSGLQTYFLRSRGGS